MVDYRSSIAEVYSNVLSSAAAIASNATGTAGYFSHAYQIYHGTPWWTTAVPTTSSTSSSVAWNTVWQTGCTGTTHTYKVDWPGITYTAGGIQFNLTGQVVMPPPPSARDQLRDIIARRSIGPSVGSRSPVLVDVDDREQRARDTFRRVVGDDTFRRFLRDGFVSVKARSGRVYLVYPGYCKTRVFEKGRELQSLCVVLPGAFPPTDSLITRYLMILNDEAGFVGLAVKHGVPYRYPARPAVVDDDTLPAIAASLRRVG